MYLFPLGDLNEDIIKRLSFEVTPIIIEFRYSEKFNKNDKINKLFKRYLVNDTSKIINNNFNHQNNIEYYKNFFKYISDISDICKKDLNFNLDKNFTNFLQGSNIIIHQSNIITFSPIHIRSILDKYLSDASILDIANFSLEEIEDIVKCTYDDYVSLNPKKFKKKCDYTLFKYMYFPRIFEWICADLNKFIDDDCNLFDNSNQIYYPLITILDYQVYESNKTAFSIMTNI